MFKGRWWRRLFWCTRGKHIGEFACIDCGSALYIDED